MRGLFKGSGRWRLRSKLVPLTLYRLYELCRYFEIRVGV